MVDPITIGAGLAIGSAVLGAVRRRRRLEAKTHAPALVAPVTPAHAASDPAKSTSSRPSSTSSEGVVPASREAPTKQPATVSKTPLDLIAPAYPGLVSASRAVRQALVDVATELDLPIFALATVIESESNWNPREPKKAEGTPRAGLIQLTEGANLAPYTTKEKIWALRETDAEWQLRNVALPYFKRFGKMLDRVRKSDDPSFALYQLNFLPGDIGKPDTFRLGEKDNTSTLPKSKITRHNVWRDNPGFAAGKNYFTWGDVRARVRVVEKNARGKWVAIDGSIGDAPDKRTPPKTVAVGTPSKTSSPTFAEGSSCSVAISLRGLLREIDQAFPNRLRASDGLCGDKAHQERQSDHNDGNAIDITFDPQNGPDLEALAALLLQDKRCKYVIWNKRIASPEVNSGAWRKYPIDPKNEGKVNPHTRHLHLSVRNEVRDESRRWGIELLKNVPAKPQNDETDKLLLDPVRAWLTGKVDNFQWVPLTISEYRLEVAADCLSVNGVRVPVSFANVVAMCAKQDMLPNTKAIVDARWNAGERRIVLRTRPPNNNGPDATLVREAKEWSGKMGPLSRSLIAGPWKEWVLDDVKQPGNATNYGLWGPTGKPIQSLGHRHPDFHVDDSQMFAPVRRKATKNGAQIDLLDELAKGCPLGGPIPKWLVEKLK